MKGEHKTAEYRAIALNARIPALQLDDGTVIMESTAICRYLESLYPEPNLFGESPIEIASIEMASKDLQRANDPFSNGVSSFTSSDVGIRNSK